MELPELESSASAPPVPGSPLPTEPEAVPQAPPRKAVYLKFAVPQGNMTSLMSLLYNLRHNFAKLTLELQAEEGEIPEQEYVQNIEEILKHLGIKLEDQES